MSSIKWGLAGAAAVLFALADTGACRAQAPAASEPAAQAAPDIVMYATSTCPYCRQARDYLRARGLAWRERDIEASAAARAEWQARGGVGTPLLVVDGTAIAGFDRTRLESALAHYAP